MMETDLRDEECICWACPLYSGYSKWFPVSYLQIDNVEIALLLVDTVTKRAYIRTRKTTSLSLVY